MIDFQLNILPMVGACRWTLEENKLLGLAHAAKGPAKCRPFFSGVDDANGRY